MARFDELETFVRVVDAGSLSRAAERMGVAKSAVSRRLAALESRLGARLLNRTTRSLSLTDSGSSFYQRAVRLITDLEETEASVSSQHATLQGTLRIAAPLSFGLLHLGPAVQEFGRTHSSLRLHIDFNDRQMDLVEEGFDVAVRIARLRDSSLIARRLTRIREVVCASPEYLARHGRPRKAADLANHVALRYTNVPDAPWQYRAPDGSEGTVRVRSGIEANNGDFLRDCAIAGLGILRQPTFIVYRAIEEGHLEPLLTDHHWPEFNAYALYPSARHLSQRVRVFVDFLQARFGDNPYWDRCLEN